MNKECENEYCGSRNVELECIKYAGPVGMSVCQERIKYQKSMDKLNQAAEGVEGVVCDG